MPPKITSLWNNAGPVTNSDFAIPTPPATYNAFCATDDVDAAALTIDMLLVVDDPLVVTESKVLLSQIVILVPVVLITVSVPAEITIAPATPFTVLTPP